MADTQPESTASESAGANDDHVTLDIGIDEPMCDTTTSAATKTTDIVQKDAAQLENGSASDPVVDATSNEDDKLEYETIETDDEADAAGAGEEDDDEEITVIDDAAGKVSRVRLRHREKTQQLQEKRGNVQLFVMFHTSTPVTLESWSFRAAAPTCSLSSERRRFAHYKTQSSTH